jgi:hypothetical protein
MHLVFHQYNNDQTRIMAGYHYDHFHANYLHPFTLDEKVFNDAWRNWEALDVKCTWDNISWCIYQLFKIRPPTRSKESLQVLPIDSPPPHPQLPAAFTPEVMEQVTRANAWDLKLWQAARTAIIADQAKVPASIS